MDINTLDLHISCYAHAAYHEAGNQQEIIGVLNIVRNRLKSGGFGKDPCEIIYANGQFQGVTDETHDEVDKKRYLEIKSLAIDALILNKYKNPVFNKLHFYDDSITTPLGWKNCNIKIGRLVFCD
jgi:spore germination cell wall hydrolase CwlJ-like protein